MIDIKSIFVSDDLTLRDALATLDRTAQGILLIVDKHQKLLRTVTDGDIRRLILKGHALDSTLKELPMQEPKFIRTYENPANAVALMNKFDLGEIPVVDENGIPQSLLRRNIAPSILLSTPHLGEFEYEFVLEAFKTNWIAPLGPNVDAFEKEIAEYVGVDHSAAVCSGTAAIHLALRLLNTGPGDVVFCSSLTFVASANPILYQGAKPIFIDAEPESWNMSPQALRRAFQETSKKGIKPKAVVLTHLYGQCADMDPILDICNDYKVPLIEDAAESLGATYKGKSSGSFGKFGIFSFNGNKIITTSGGGMLVSFDRELIERAKFLSTQARDVAPHYEHSEVGYNYRMSNVLAGIGRGQLRMLEQRINARRKVFNRYVEGLSGISEIEWMPEPSYSFSTRWLSAMLINSKNNIQTSQLINYLAKNQIEARPVWKPMHIQPLFKGCDYYPHFPDNSVSDDIFSRGICLPSGSNLSLENQNHVIQVIRDFFHSFKKHTHTNLVYDDESL